MAVPEVKRARDSGVLMGGVGTIGVIVLTIVLIAASLLALYSLMVFWPPTLSDADLGKVLPDTHSDWFGIPWVLDRDRSLMLMVAIAGATGAMAYVLRSFFKYVGERHLVWSWVPSYLMTPVVGALLAVLTYIVVRAGLISGGPSSVGNPFGFAAIATLVGSVLGAGRREAQAGLRDTVRDRPARQRIAGIGGPAGDRKLRSGRGQPGRRGRHPRERARHRRCGDVR